jgi:dihydropteroate synthase
MQKDPQYNDVIGNIEKFFLERMIFAESHGIKREQIILDPGIGFGKTFEHNLTILRRLHEFRSLGRPLLVGASRKAFIGRALGDIPPQGRLAGSLAAHIRAVEQGAHIVRVHDVKETGEALRIITAIHHIHY